MLKRLSSIREIISTAALLSIALTPATVLCQDVPVVEDEQASSEPIAEITVYADKTVLHYRLEMFRAEDKVFTLFNSLNSDDEFDIHCYKEAPSGTRIRRRICKANYVKEAEAREAMNYLLGRPGNPADMVIRHKHDQLIEQMDRLIGEHPQLLVAVVEYATAIDNVESALKERCAGLWLFACRNKQ